MLITAGGLIGAAVVFFFITRTPGGAPVTNPGNITDMSGYNLIIINIDALRADHLGCYGYHRDTSPFIDSLAGEGIVFEKAFSNSSFTRESVAVLFSGRLPSSSGSTGWLATLPKKADGIAKIFARAGYKTACISSSIQLKFGNLKAGFNHFECLADTWGMSRGGPKLSARAIDFVRQNKDRKFMMYLHYLDPHGPYDPPPEFYRRFTGKPHPRPVKLYKALRKKCHRLMKRGFGPGDKQFEDLIVRYDAEIAHTDHSIRLLFNGLKKENRLKNTVVIITADHGEEFLEHEYVEHAWTLYNESLHVPLILWAPGVIPPQRIASLVSIVDIPPTILELMDVPHRREHLEGDPLLKPKDGGFHFTPPKKPFIAELLVQHRNLVRTVIHKDWKYISARKWLPPHRRPAALTKNVREFEKNTALHMDTWGPVTHEELYNLAADPGEKRNLLEEHDARRRKFKEILRTYRVYCRRKGLKSSPGGKNRAPISKEDLKKLKSLGYL